jgi:hypothetical protein
MKPINTVITVLNTFLKSYGDMNHRFFFWPQWYLLLSLKVYYKNKYTNYMNQRLS